MIKIKLGDVVNSIEQIKSLQEVAFPVKISYKISRLVSKLNPELVIYNDARNKIVKEYGEVNPETKMIEVKDPEKMKLFAEKITDVLSTEIEIDWFEKIKISDLGEVKIEAKNLVEFIFEE